MNKRTWVKALVVGMGVASLAMGGEARAADPVAAGSANIGTHPSYPGATYSGFWRTGRDYALLADNSNTFLNAPSANGTLFFRGANSDWAQLSKYGFWLGKARFTNGWISVGELSDNNQDGVASIGHHPAYGKGFAGFWFSTPNLETKHWDYSLLTDGGDTYVNAPDADGAVYFRSGNANNAYIVRQGLTLVRGSAAKPGGGAWSAASDSRVKKDVKRFEAGLAELEQVRPITFKYNGLGGTIASDQQFVGVLAQELEKTLPSMVTSEAKKLHPSDQKTTDIKQVDPSAFTYALINAVQKLSKQNKALAAQNEQIKRVLCKQNPNETLCKP